MPDSSLTRAAWALLLALGCGDDGMMDAMQAEDSGNGGSCMPGPKLNNDPLCPSAAYADLPSDGAPCPRVGLTCSVLWPTGNPCFQPPMALESRRMTANTPQRYSAAIGFGS